VLDPAVGRGGASAPTLAELLRRWRERAGLTQEELAERAGLTPHAVSALERGTRTRPYPHTVRSLADGLALSDSDRARLLAAVPSRVVTAGPATTDPRPVSGQAAPPTALLGRADDVATVVALLRRPGTRLVTLTGTGGVGKTRLAAAVADAAHATWPDGVTFVPLAAVTDADLVVPSIGRALGIATVEGSDAATVVADHLRPLRRLLVLDNLEHLLVAAPQVGALVAECPGLTALVTSRAPLRVRGEHEHRVQPLALPDPEAGPADVARAPATALFVERAQAVSPEFALTPANSASVAAICARLAGIPLAVELAAARVRLLGPADLLRRLDEAMATPGARDLPARQQTMRATLDWSHGLLGDGERRLLRRLAAFSGGFSLDAVESVVVAAGELRQQDVVPLLEALVEHSLVVVAEQAGGGRRYRMLEPVRQYARLLLDASDDADATGLAHAHYFLALAEQAAPEYEQADQVAWLERTQADHDNFSAALEWCLVHGEAEIAARTGWALWLYWWLRGQLRHGRRCVEAALEHPLSPPVRARALLTVSALAFAQGDLESCARTWPMSYDVARAIEDPVALVGAAAGIGLVHLATGDLAAAGTRFREAIACGEPVGRDAEWCVALAHLWLGTVELVGGDPTAASVHLSRGLASARRRGDRLATYIGLFNLSQAAIAQGDLALARRHLEEGMLLSQETGDLANLAYFLDELAVVEAGQGQHSRVGVLLGAAQALRETVGSNVYGYYLPDDALRLNAAEQARAALGEDGFDDVVDTGRALSPEEVVSYAVVAGAPDPAVRA
jgi:predicted ATPase/transcriptional regulator with XRE-family HTH domain